MGIALSIVKRKPTGGFMYAFFGGCLVIAIGVVFALALPGTFDLVGNSQISGRTTPGVLDLVAAVATGLAGAVALSRRDVAAVLPGVAISISLVPPLAVVGICAGATFCSQQARSCCSCPTCLPWYSRAPWSSRCWAMPTPRARQVRPDARD